MSRPPLMPRATAVWLVENTALTFQQIAEFCHMHVLEIQGIADGEVASGVRGIDPTKNGQLLSNDITKAEADPSIKLKMIESAIKLSSDVGRKGPRYTPLSRRHDRPNAILWLLRNHAELKDAQISRLAGTTKSTIEAVRMRTHWNYSNLTPSDPVILGLCKQMELDFEIKRAAKSMPKPPEQTDTDDNIGLAPLDQNNALNQPVINDDSQVFASMSPAKPEPEEPTFDPDSVFAKLKDIKDTAST